MGSAMTSVRPPAVAGRFYPAEPGRLRATIRALLGEAAPPVGGTPRALIVPHAGYRYSGPIAATGYARLAPMRGAIRRVVLLGTAHSPVRGLAASSADAFATPLGRLAIDRDALATILDLPQVSVDDRAHARDHALEVQLPFVQEVIGPVEIVPLLVGRATPEEVAEVLGRLWDGDRTLVVVSSDLSHYHPYDEAGALDRATAEAIEGLRFDGLDAARACGHAAIAGLLLAARRRGLMARLLDLRNSGDTGGPRERVVGYGAFAFETAAPSNVGASPGSR